MPNLSILILAAGKGVRMKSSLPKVLHPVAGVPMLERVLRSALALKPSSICVITGHGGKQISSYVKPRFPKVTFVTQKRLDGTGGAVRQAGAWLKKQRGHVLITCGDAPLLSATSFKSLLSNHRKERNAATVLTAIVDNPKGYGRIIRGYSGDVRQIVEELDATPHQRNVNEINTGTYCFDAGKLRAVLAKIKNDNAKKEYYLTDTLDLLREAGNRVGGVDCEDPREAIGVNRRRDLARAEKFALRRKIDQLLNAGVTFMDPDSTYISEQVQIGPDTVIWPQTFVLGQSKIGRGCSIGPWAHITDCIVENDVILQATFAEKGIIRKGAKVGPFSRVRPKSDVGPDVHLGNFSEVKNTRLAAGSKVNHLTYLGDAKVGKNVNIGAGTITCNYDGFHKHPTTIKDHAFIGSNVNLIAPLTVGAHAVVGAGSSINKNVPDWALSVERAGTKVKRNWARKKRGKKK